MLISLNINANDTTTEDIQNQITEIIETLKHAQQLLNNGESIQEFDEPTTKEIKKLDFTNLSIQILTSQNGLLAVHLE